MAEWTALIAAHAPPSAAASLTVQAFTGASFAGLGVGVVATLAEVSLQNLEKSVETKYDAEGKSVPLTFYACTLGTRGLMLSVGATGVGLALSGIIGTGVALTATIFSGGFVLLVAAAAGLVYAGLRIYKRDKLQTALGIVDLLNTMDDASVHQAVAALEKKNKTQNQVFPDMINLIAHSTKSDEEQCEMILRVYRLKKEHASQIQALVPEEKKARI